MNGLIHNDLVISILVVTLLTAVGRLILGVFSVGVQGAAVFVAAGYVVVYLSVLLWDRLRRRNPFAAADTILEPVVEETADAEDPAVAESGAAVQA